jgi:hypothetical protein
VIITICYPIGLAPIVFHISYVNMTLSATHRSGISVWYTAENSPHIIKGVMVAYVSPYIGVLDGDP